MTTKKTKKNFTLVVWHALAARSEYAIKQDRNQEELEICHAGRTQKL